MKNRFKRYRNSRREPVLDSVTPSELTPEEVLFLALHARQRLLDRIGKAAGASEEGAWVEAIAGAYASLLQHCDIEDHPRIYHVHNEWAECVCPPSVIASELMTFLGGLSVTNEEIYAGCRRRGSIQGFLAIVPELGDRMRYGVEERVGTRGGFDGAR